MSSDCLSDCQPAMRPTPKVIVFEFTKLLKKILRFMNLECSLIPKSYSLLFVALTDQSLLTFYIAIIIIH